MRLTMKLAAVMIMLVSIVACGKSDVEKSKEFINGGMFPQAIELLSKRITESPEDAEAHFLLGVAFINTGKIGEADERFASAIRLKSDYGYQIGGEYKKAGMDVLNKGNAPMAIGLFAKAIEFQPDLGKEIIGVCYEKSMELAKKKDYRTPQLLMDFASNSQYADNTKAAETYKALYDETGELGYLANAVQLNGEYKPLFDQAFIKWCEGKSIADKRQMYGRYSSFISDKTRMEYAPPPKLTKVAEYQHTGKGMGFDDYVKAVCYGKEYNPGDILIIKGTEFQAFANGEAQNPVDGTIRVDTKNTKKSGCQLVRAPKGIKFTAEVWRMM